MTSVPLKVSVVIPFFNTQKRFLREAVESALHQENISLEILLVDDGSERESASIAMDLAESSDGRVRYLSHPDRLNRGTSATRNLGVSESVGEFIAFLDSDDVWRTAKLAEQIEIFTDLPDVALVFGQSEYWFDWQPGSADAPQSFIPNTGARQQRVLQPPEFIRDFLRGRIIVPNPSNFMVRRSAYEACGGFEESFPGMYDDQVFLAKLGLENDVCVVPRCWDRYRQHANSLSAQAQMSASEQIVRRRFLLWLQQYCQEKGTSWPEVSEAISKELWLCHVGDGEQSSAGRRRLRWVKKWLLRLEETIIPPRVRQLWWCRENQEKDQGNA
jgi:glycosyltransferase involved in cell wall biosynthesis